MMERLLLVGGGAALGAMARYALGLWAAQALGVAFPYGTLIVNATGSLLLALGVVITTERLGLGPEIRLLLGTGFCGGYTTFSTFALETVALVEAQAYGRAVLYVVASLALSLLGVLGGLWLARLG